MTDHRRTAGTGFILAAVAAALAGAGLLATPPRPAADLGTVPAAPPVPATPTTSPATTSPATTSPATTSPTGPEPAASPIRLRIPALAIDAPVRPVTVDRAGQLAIPEDPRQVGWWAGGAAPGAATGTVVLAGHVDTARAGPGALFALHRAASGDLVRLQTSRQGYAYRVVARRSYPKSRLPAAVFDQAVAPRLALITCGGRFENGRYEQNLVVYAQPAGPAGR